MTAMIIRVLASLWCMVLLSVQGLASEPTPYLEPTEETRPAVDGINAKLSFLGAVDGTETYGAVGALTIPLGYQYGLQLDGAAASVDAGAVNDVGVYAGAAHLFWRDPSRGLLGLYARALHVDILGGFNTFAFAAEGAIYQGRLTVEGMVGAAGGDVETSFLSLAIAKYYPADNLALHIGHTFKHDTHALIVGGEWGLPFSGEATASSIFVDGHVSDNGTSSALAGLRFYFGRNDKSLIRRHREDDPSAIDTHIEMMALQINTYRGHTELQLFYP